MEDQNEQENQTKRNKLVLAYLGLTKSGKTSSLTAPAKKPEQIVQVANGDKEGRTKAAVEYHFVTEGSDDMQIEEIDCNVQAIMGSPDAKNIDKFNEELAKSKILTDIFKLEPVDEKENLKEYIDSKIEELKLRNSVEDIKKLINAEGIDQYIRRVTIKVKANDDFGAFLLNKNIELYVRDTRGLLDVALESDENGNRKIKNVQSLKDLGLNDVNGVVFFCNETYPEVVSTIYEDVFKNVFQAVPLFLMARDHSMMKLFRSNQQPETYENVKCMLENIQNENSEAYQEVEEEYFFETFALLEKFGVVLQENVGGYKFRNSYFKQSQMEFLTSECTTLKKFSHGTISAEDIPNDKDFKFFQKTMLFAVEKMVEKILELHEGVNKLIAGGCATDLLCNEIRSGIVDLSRDFDRYDNPWQSSEATMIVKPQLKGVTKERIESDLINKEVAVIGKYNGITTLQNGKLRYPSTAICAVTSRRLIYSLIFKIKLESDLLDKNKEKLFPSMAGDYARQTSLVRQVLLYILYHRFTDPNATINNYLILKRKIIVDSICKLRKDNFYTFPFVRCIEIAFYDFCAQLESISNLRQVFQD